MLTDDNVFGEVRSYLARESPSREAFSHLELLLSFADLSPRTVDLLYPYLEGSFASWDPSFRSISDLEARGLNRDRYLGLVRHLSLREEGLKALWDRSVFQDLMFLDIYALTHSVYSCREILMHPYLQNMEMITLNDPVNASWVEYLRLIELLGKGFAPKFKALRVITSQPHIFPIQYMRFYACELSSLPNMYFDVIDEGEEIRFELVRA